MKCLFRLCGLLLALTWLPAAWSQLSADKSAEKIAKVEIHHVGPAAASDELILANIRVKPGDEYKPAAVDDDVRNLYATGFFYDIRIARSNTASGLVLTYLVQGNPRLTDIKFQGNQKFSEAKLRKTISAKPGEPFSERKLFTDAQAVRSLYEKKGYQRTEVTYTFSIDPAAGRATETFNIKESPKVKIIEVDFVGAQAFTPARLRKLIKTRKHWMFSWLTGSGHLKEEQLEDDREKLADFYRNGSGKPGEGGYLDFEIKNVEFINPTPETLIVRFTIYEGTQYRVGAVKFSGNKLFSDADLMAGLRLVNAGKKGKIGPNGLTMDFGDVFTPKGMAADIEEVEDFYGSRGYIDVATSSGHLNVVRVPNTETGTMDLEFRINEGQKAYIEKIEIRGNTKTKDRVIRRELSVSPGDVFDSVRVKRSKQRLEGLQYFDKVDTRPEATEVAGHKNLVLAVDEKNTGSLSMGAGFSSVDSLVGFVEMTQANFDLFHPPTFTGGGQRFRLRLAIGTEQQDYEASFIEPWFLGRKLTLGVDLFYRDLAYLSPNNIYDETRAGGRVGLTRALGSDFLIGGVNYTIENVGIHLNSGWNAINTPAAIMEQVGYNLISRVGGSLAYDRRGPGLLPSKGQKTELTAEFAGGPLGGDFEFYKLELRSGWYFKGFAQGHVLELAGRTGVAQSLQSQDVPFYERYYLGGLYSLRGFKFHNIAPRDPSYHTTNPLMSDEPIGGDTYWFGTVEYSIPIIEQHSVGVRFALFYDIGNVAADSYSWRKLNFDDNWGLGLRLNLPIGPIRLDYGIPITHDQYNSGSGQFQFGVGYTREF
jgi:outer membrane protein insertion porin family